MKPEHRLAPAAEATKAKDAPQRQVQLGDHTITISVKHISSSGGVALTAPVACIDGVLVAETPATDSFTRISVAAAVLVPVLPVFPGAGGLSLIPTN